MNQVDIENMSEETAVMVLFLHYLIESSQQVSNMWSDFEDTIKYRNRYFPEGELLQDIERFKDKSVTTIKPREIFYRAREFYDPFWAYYSERKQQIIGIIKNHYPKTKEMGEKEFFKLLQGLDLVKDINKDLIHELNKVFRDEKYLGYNEKDSDAPPDGKTSAGRANPDLISYLYISGDEKTAIQEIKPHVGQEISVAEIVIEKELIIYDFLKEVREGKEEGFFTKDWFSFYFSRVNFGKKEDYYSTQCICEYIKKLGFDGVRFRSSINPEGENTVLFDTRENPDTGKKNYSIVGSDVYKVQSVDLQYVPVMMREKNHSD